MYNSKREFWMKKAYLLRIRDWQNGMTDADWCRENGIRLRDGGELL